MPPLVASPAGAAQFDPAAMGAMEEEFCLSFREEAHELFRLAKDARGSIIEIGTYCGYTALFLAFGIRNRPAAEQDGAELYTVDTHRNLSPEHERDDDLFDMRIRGEACSWRRLMQRAKRHHVWDLLHPVIDDSAQAWRYLRPGRCGMLHIDGDHGEARRDFEQWAGFLEEGDIVTFHDYSPFFPLVMRDVDALVAAGRIERLGLTHRLFVSRLKQRLAAPSTTPLRRHDGVWGAMYRWWIRHDRPLLRTALFLRYTLLGWYRR